jgi:PAS domain S-box-containing protein
MTLPVIIKFACVFLAYFITGIIGLSLATVNESATPIWAPTGIAIASFVLFGKKVWPVIWLAAFFTNLVNAGSIGSSAGIAIGNTLEGFVAGYLIKQFAGALTVFDKPRKIFKFLIIVSISCMISATWGISSLLLSDLARADDAIVIWLTWWLGDLTGAFIVTPLIVSWSRKSAFKWIDKRQLEGIVLILGLIIVAGAVFNGLFLNIKQTLPLEFLCIPIIVWIALRFDQKLTSFSIAILAAIAIWGTVHGFGSFARYEIGVSLLLLQSFMGVVALTAFALSAVVTDRERVKARFQSTVDNMREGFQIIGFDWRYVYVNNAVAAQGKRAKEELLGKTMMEMYPGIENTKFFTHLRRCMDERVAHSMENKFEYPDGTSAWFALKMEPVNEGVLILSVDINEQKEDQKKLAEDKAQAEALLNSIGDGIIATDGSGKIIMVNQAFEEQLGFKKSEVLGSNSFDKILMEDEGKNVLQESERPLNRALSTGQKITLTHYLVRKNGTKFLARVTASPVVVNDMIIGAIKVFHDITKEREVEEMKNEFIAMASHELRTPLSVVKGFVSMINMGDYGAVGMNLKKPLEHIAASTERLIKIVNEMLNVSRIDVNRVDIKKESMDLNDLVGEIISESEGSAHAKGLKIYADTSKKVMVWGDREKIFEIIKNMIENAIKYTEKGSVMIRISEKGSRAIVEVEDTGVGILEADQKKLFNKFEQIKSKRTGSTGIGLGLYIAREIARMMKGDLWIKRSEFGRGSTFAYSVPLYISKNAEQLVN